MTQIKNNVFFVILYGIFIVASASLAQSDPDQGIFNTLNYHNKTWFVE